MSSIANPQSEPPAADDLVAYLDGELAPEECRRVEQRLAADADYRQQLHDLDEAWEALDSLPVAKATDDFARTTMELVTVAAEGDVSKVTASADAARRTRRAWKIAVGAAAVALSFVVTKAILPDPNRKLIDDLPAIVHADTLQLIPNVEFLRQLADEVPAESLMSDEAAARQSAEHYPFVSSNSLEVRREWVESLPAEQKSKLASQASRFAPRLQEQERLRELTREIRDASDANHLQLTLVAYGQWLAGLSAGRQEQLREEMADLGTAQQVDLVRDFVRRENARASQQLSDEDAERLRQEVLRIAQEHRGVLMRELRHRGDVERIRELGEPGVALMILTREIWNDQDEDRIRDRLFNSLSQNAQVHLERLDRRSQRRQLYLWVRESLQTKVGPDDLGRFFASEKLDNDARERLLNLPADDMQSQLERMYFASQLGLGETAPWWNELGNRGDERRPPPGPPPGFRPDGPRHDRDHPPGPPPFDRNRRGPGPDRPPGPDGPRGDDFRGPPPDGPPRPQQEI